MANIYHLNSGTFSLPFSAHKGVTHVLLVKTNQGWVLIDSGFGLKDFTAPDWVTRIFMRIMAIDPDPMLSMINQVQSMGIQPKDVSHIIFTHLHLDHAGGLTDFPWVTAHVYQREWVAAKKREGLLGLGYQKHQWKNHQHWQFYGKPDGDWFGFPAITLPGFDPAICLIPLPGHTAGHCMVAIQTETGWLLQSGSAVFPFDFEQIIKTKILPRWLLRLFWGNNRWRLNQLIRDHGHQIEIVTGHDFNLWFKHQPE
jgi:glyoxylase-like metal-dependent hydrolase (beta-lactamase superfamily II)